MNIKRAKQEIRDSIEAYLAKDEFGEYRIPAIRQRPILLMGSGNRKDTGYGADRKGMRDCPCSLYYYPPHQTECRGTSFHCKKRITVRKNFLSRNIP